MNGVVVKMVGSKLVVEVDILKAIAELCRWRPGTGASPWTRALFWQKIP
jgi:hypothetical protein